MSSIQDLRSIHNPQKSYMWEVSITGGVASPLKELSFYAKTAVIPQSAVEQIVINHKASKTHHAGRDSSGHSVTLTFWDNEDQTIQRYFYDWMQTIHNEVTGGAVTRDIYSANVVLKLRDSNDQNTTGSIRLTNAFPIDLSDISLSYDGSEPVEISVTMSYDSKIME